jgi:hypothetical protein
MTAELTDNDVNRIRRTGISPLTAETGMALFDAALAADTLRCSAAGSGLAGPPPTAPARAAQRPGPHGQATGAGDPEGSAELHGGSPSERRRSAPDDAALVNTEVAAACAPDARDRRRPGSPNWFRLTTAVELRTGSTPPRPAPARHDLRPSDARAARRAPW